jgi:hypothetical protein
VLAGGNPARAEVQGPSTRQSAVGRAGSSFAIPTRTHLAGDDRLSEPEKAVPGNRRPGTTVVTDDDPAPRRTAPQEDKTVKPKLLPSDQGHLTNRGQSSTRDDCLNSAELPLGLGRIRASLRLDHLNFKEDEASRSREASSSLKFR